MRHAAFTLIELLVVLSIIAMLSALGMPVAMRSLAIAQMNRESGAILGIASQARTFAMQQQEPANARCYGVAIIAEPGGRQYAALTWRGPDDTAGDARDYVLVRRTDGSLARAVEDPQGVAVARRQLTASQIFIADKPASVAATPVAAEWYYQYRTGHVISLTEPTQAGLPPSMRGLAMVGTAPLAMSGCTDSNRNLWGIAAYTVDSGSAPTRITDPVTSKDLSLPVIARGNANQSRGLSLRSRDGSLRMALAVYATGFATAGIFPGEADGGGK